MWPFRLWRWRFEIQAVADKYGFEPALIAAIMDRESLGGEALTPPTRLGTGDNGHGRGLMQIDDRAHPSFCENIDVWGDAMKNIDQGAQVMVWARKLCQNYLPGIPAIYNAGWSREKRLPDGTIEITPWIREEFAQRAQPPVATLDRFTAHHDYVYDVMGRYERLRKVQFT